MSNVTWTLSATQKSAREVLVYVDPAKLDAAWAKDDPGFRIPPGGGGAEIAGRRACFVEFMAKGLPVEASRICLDRKGQVSFVDGRHRFSVLRDMGAAKVAVSVKRSQAAKVAALYA